MPAAQWSVDAYVAADVIGQLLVGLAAEHDIQVTLNAVFGNDFCSGEHFAIAGTCVGRRRVTESGRCRQLTRAPAPDSTRVIEHGLIRQVVAKNVAIGVEQINLGGRVDDHRVTLQVHADCPGPARRC